MTHAQAYPHHPIQSLPFYILGLDRLTTAQKLILLAVADCYARRKPFQPSLAVLARLCSCSRRSVMRALCGLDGRHGWIRNEWRGGRKTNIYSPGWRLAQLMQRAKITKGGN